MEEEIGIYSGREPKKINKHLYAYCITTIAMW